MLCNILTEDSDTGKSLVHRFRNNYTIHLLANPIAQVEKPRRSPLRLRFYTYTLESASYAIGIVIYETMY